MKIKKFEAGSFREALARVKKELGHEAVILSSEEIGGLKPMVEVVAAIDQDVDREEIRSAYSQSRNRKEKGLNVPTKFLGLRVPLSSRPRAFRLIMNRSWRSFKSFGKIWKP